MKLDDPKILTVSGRGEFPWDMLRYDQCYPSSTSDAMKMAAPLVPTTGHEEREFWSAPRTITLISHARHPQPDRWASFGWACNVNYP